MGKTVFKYGGSAAVLLVTVSLLLWLYGRRGPEAIGEVSSEESEEAGTVGDSAIPFFGNGEQESEFLEEQPSERKVLEVGESRRVALGYGHTHRLGVWHGRLVPEPSTWNLQERSQPFALRLPDGNEYEVRLGRKGGDGVSRELFAGEVVGADESTVIISRYNSAVSGVVRLPYEGVAWELRNRGNGLIEWEKVDLSALSECTRCGVGEQ